MEADKERYSSGQAIGAGGRVNYISSGMVAVYSTKGNQRSFLFSLKAGEFFPYTEPTSELFSGRRLDYVALSTVTIRTMSRQEFERRIKEPANSVWFISKLLFLLQLQTERIDNLSRGSTEQKLIERLNFLAERHGKHDGDTVTLKAPLTHTDIATSIGTTRETANRFIKRLERKGLVSVRRQNIVINSISELRTMAKSSR